jgi:hypothetical protein
LSPSSDRGLADCFISPHESNQNLEPANVVDGLRKRPPRQRSERRAAHKVPTSEAVSSSNPSHSGRLLDARKTQVTESTARNFQNLMVRDQEVGGSNPLAPTNSFNNLQTTFAKTAHPD